MAKEDLLTYGLTDGSSESSTQNTYTLAKLDAYVQQHQGDAQHTSPNHINEKKRQIDTENETRHIQEHINKT
jgi:hypothetical protein